MLLRLPTYSRFHRGRNPPSLLWIYANHRSKREHTPCGGFEYSTNSLRHRLYARGRPCCSGCRHILGSTAEGILRHYYGSTLTIGPNVNILRAGALNIRRILYATDCTPEAAHAAPVADIFSVPPRKESSVITMDLR